MNRALKLLLLLQLSLLSGCPAVLLGGAAAGAALYNHGSLTATRNVTLDRAFIASRLALEDLGVIIVSKERDGLTALLVAKGAEEKEIKIRLKKIFDDVTEINIRIGFLGNELQSRLIFDRIEKFLETDEVGTGVAPALP